MGYSESCIKMKSSFPSFLSSFPLYMKTKKGVKKIMRSLIRSRVHDVGGIADGYSSSNVENRKSSGYIAQTEQIELRNENPSIHRAIIA